MSGPKGWTEAFMGWTRTLPGNNTVHVAASRTQGPPQARVTAGAPSVWLRLNGGVWSKVQERMSISQAAKKAEDLEWVRAVVEAWKENAASLEIIPSASIHYFRGKNDLYTIHQTFRDGGSVRNSRGRIVAHYDCHASRGKLKSLRPWEGCPSVPDGLQEFLERLIALQVPHSGG